MRKASTSRIDLRDERITHRVTARRAATELRVLALRGHHASHRGVPHLTLINRTEVIRISG